MNCLLYRLNDPVTKQPMPYHGNVLILCGLPRTSGVMYRIDHCIAGCMTRTKKLSPEGDDFSQGR